MDKFVLVDGNSIMNRAFYGIMGSKMLTTKDGKYTNAVYGFLAILFKLLDDIQPQYMAVAFDLKAPTARHKMYEGYKANRHGMPDELAEQMPIIKEVLRAMNIDIIEMEGYEADDILGTLSCYGETKNLDVTILSGDRDTFQLATDKVTIRIPHTKGGKTETDEYNREKIIEKYGLEPKQLIEVKGLQGDASDNIPGVPGVGEKTALKLVQKYGSIENLYKKIEEGQDDLKGKQREKIVENKELAELSRTLGTINTKVPIKDDLTDLKVEEWDKEKVLELFKNLNFNRYIDRFNLRENGESENKQEIKELYKSVGKSLKDVIGIIKNKNEMTFNLVTKSVENQSKIIKEQIIGMSVYNNENKEVYYVNLENNEIQEFKEIFEEEKIRKIGIDLSKTYILLKQENINLKGIYYDIAIASYIINPTNNKLKIEDLIQNDLKIDIETFIGKEETQAQMTLFEVQEEDNKQAEIQKEKSNLYAYSIGKIKEKTEKELEEIFIRTYGKVERKGGLTPKTYESEYAKKQRKKEEAMQEYLLVDGYNVIFAWEELKELAKVSIEAARDKLMDILCNYQGYKKCVLILVFDAYKVEGYALEIQKYHNIHVVYTKEAETADQYIEKVVHHIGRKYHVTVVTSDGVEQVITMGQGGTRISSRDFLEEIEYTKKLIEEDNEKQRVSDRNYLFDHADEEFVKKMEKIRLGKETE